MNTPQEAIKVYTNTGKVIARFTMWVLFYPQFRKPGTDGTWTYRADQVRENFAHRPNGIFFDNDAEAMKYQFNLIFHRCQEIKKFDNTKPFKQSMFQHWINGKKVYPL